MSSEFTLRGIETEFTDADGFQELYQTDTGFRSRIAVRTSSSDRAGGNVVELTGADDDIVEIEDPDGIVRFERAGPLLEKARAAGAVRGSGEADLTSFLDTRGDARGGSRAAVRTVAVRRYSVTLPADVAAQVAEVDRIVGQSRGTGPFDLEPDAIVDLVPGRIFDLPARAAMKKVIDWVDRPVDDDAPGAQRRRRPKVPGVYRVGEDIVLERDDRLQGDDRAIADKPYLLLLHGTFSHTEGAFRNLRTTPEWATMVSRYGGRVLALEHPTLGLTPAENALAAVPLLPRGARLHLLSHSRGGLVGEVLSHCAAGPDDVRIDGYDADHPDCAALRPLLEAVRERRITVERFARVACPARGTTLASRRLDRWAWFLFNVFNLVPAMRETGAAALVKKFLLAVLDQRTDPRTVPGIEAQMPQSPFLRMLYSAPPVDDGLGSVTGDVEGDGVVRRLLVGLGNAYYREDHDYVVQTSSMSGGIPRTDGQVAFFQSTRVNHSAYFGNPESRRAVAAWLAAGAGTTVEGFARVGPPDDRRVRGTRAGPAGSVAELGRPLLVPDAFGVVLTRDGVPVWPAVGEHLRRGSGHALDPAGELDAVGLVDEYAALRATLGVEPVCYDPRRGLHDAAALVATSLRGRLGDGRQAHLVTHGVGALVALMALTRPWEADGADAAETVAEHWSAAGNRAVLLSPPLDGSWTAAAHVAGSTELCASLELLNNDTTAQSIGAMFGTWPLVRILDPGDEDRRCWKEIDVIGSERISCIYGVAPHTVCAIVDEQFRTSPNGDGCVLHPGRSGLARYYGRVANATMVGNRHVLAGVADLLRGEVPTQLSARPPAATSKATLPLDDGRRRLLLPTEQDLVRAAWGGTDLGARRALEVKVVHGHVRGVSRPIMVGHEDGTPLSGAEAALDRRLDGVLTRRVGLGAYPGRLGTSAVFRKPNDRLSSAVVIGLGSAGDITPVALTAAVTHGVLSLAAGYFERRDDEAVVEISLAAVLVGTSLVPPLPVENSVNALVTGVRHANRRLHDAGERIAVTDLEIVELYEDRAVAALHACRRLTREDASSEENDILVHQRIVDGRDGRPGSPSTTEHHGAWRTVRVVNAEPRYNPSPDEELVELSFTSVGRAARAEQRVNTGQRSLIDELVAEAIDNPDVDDQLFNTLYELIVPNSLKGQGYGEEHLMIIVDEQSAMLPLEMLAPRSPEGVIKPIAVEVGVVRRLETRTFETLTRRAAGNAALVIGDPPGTGLPRLEAARVEARRVADVLRRGGYDVTEIVPGDDADGRPDSANTVAILNALFRRSYRVVHLAGHGDYSKDPTRSGMYIGPDRFLTALEIGKMSTAPDLVFLNCCHLGAMVPRPSRDGAARRLPRTDRLAASISRQLIDNGVAAVVAAGWAVDDRAAADFAGRFYEELLEGQDLGLAALAARKDVRENHQAVNTWGAYQVYGPPAMRLTPDRGRERDVEPPVGRSELRAALDRISRRAHAVGNAESLAVLRRELYELLDGIPPEWRSGPELGLIASVWEALAAYENAVPLLEQLKKDWRAGASLRNLEQLANLQAKWAVQLHLAGTVSNGRSPSSLLEEAETILEAVLALGRTPHRLAMLGSVKRRRARCSTGDAIDTALEEALCAYREAGGIHHRMHRRPDPYAMPVGTVVGWLVARRKGCAFEGREPAVQALRTLRKTQEREGRRPAAEFWDRVSAADIALAESLIEETLTATETRVAIGDRYVEAFTRSSRQNRMVILEHLDLIENALPAAEAEDVYASPLADLRVRLSQWQPHALLR